MNPIINPISYPEIIKLSCDNLFTKIKGIDSNEILYHHSLFYKLIDIKYEFKKLKQYLDEITNKKTKLSLSNRIFNVLASDEDKAHIQNQVNSLNDLIIKTKHDYAKTGLELNNVSSQIIKLINQDVDLYIQVKTILDPNFITNRQQVTPKAKQECPYVKVTNKQRRLDNKIRVTRLYKKYLKSIERKTTYDFLLGITYLDSLDIKKMMDDTK